MTDEYPAVKIRLPKGTDKNAVMGKVGEKLLEIGCASSYFTHTTRPSYGLLFVWIAEGKIKLTRLSETTSNNSE